MKTIIIGDLILDKFIYGDALRISPEAPALVLDVKSEICSVGGAYNVYAHIRSLGLQATLISVVGKDHERHALDFPEISDKRRISLLVDRTRITSIKTRLITNYKLSYLARFDKECTTPVPTNIQQKILSIIEKKLEPDSNLLIMDYNKGIITESLAKAVIALGRSRKARVMVDTKKDDIALFKDSFLLKPNHIEFQKIKLRFQLDDRSDSDAALILLRRFNIESMIITLGESGMRFVSKSGETFDIPGHKVEIKELSGAGDSVLAVVSSQLLRGRSMRDSLLSANRIAAKFVGSGVTYRAKSEDL